MFALVSDRPENAQLLRQSDARFLGTQQIDGTELSVFRLPSSDGSGGQTRMWLDADGALRRLDDGGEGLVLRMTDAPSAPRPDVVDSLVESEAGP